MCISFTHHSLVDWDFVLFSDEFFGEFKVMRIETEDKP